MPRKNRRPGSLAYGILKVTLTVGLITVSTAIIVTAVQAYRLAATQAEERMGAYLEVLRSEALGWVEGVRKAMEDAAALIEELPPNKSPDRVLASRYIVANDYIEQFVLLGPDGTVMSSYPRLKSELPTSTYDFARRLRAREVPVHYLPAVSGRPAGLWAARRLRLASGQQVTLVAGLRSDYLNSVTRRVASESDGRSAVVLDEGALVAVGVHGPALRLPTAEYADPSEEKPGRVGILAPSLGAMRGLWLPLDAPSATDWRVLVVEPSRATIETSLRSSVPTLLVLMFGGAIAFLVTWLVSRRLVFPLKEIETAGREAALGAYVVPLGSERDDEVGRLAAAFNAVGLRLNALHDVSRLLSGASRLDEITSAIIEAVGHLLGPGMVAIYTTDESQQSFRLADATRGFEPPPGPLLRARSGPFLEALRREDVITPDAEELPMHGWDVERPCRVLVAPMVAAGEYLGVIVALQHGRNGYSDAEVEMMRTFASQAATGVTKSRLFEREIESRELAESLREIAEELVRPVSLADALDAVSEVVSRALHDRRVVFAFGERDSLGLPASTEPLLEEMVLAAASEALDASDDVRTARAGLSPRIDDLLESVAASEVMLARIEPARSFRVAFAAFSSESAFEPQSVELVEGMAKIVTLALENAYFFERSRVRARNLETIFRISQAVGSSLQLRVVLNRVLDVVQMIFAADAVSLMTYDAQKRTVSTAMARGTISAEVLHLVVEPGEDLPGQVFATREPLMLEDIGSVNSPLATEARQLGLHAMIAVPLLARGSAVGVLSVFSVSRAAFDEEDMGLLQTFAFQAALAIDTARLYGREHQVAATLQRSILPEAVPAFEEVETATEYRPAGDEAGIGGDYYDLFRSPGGRIVIAIADVCGKGVEAATKTSMLKYSIRALVAAGFGPAECLAEVNRMVAAKSDPSDILSVWLGFLDPRAAVLTWASGGHPPGLLLRAESREIVRLSPTGPILGATTDVDYKEESVGMDADDCLLLYTDGVTEARSGGKFFGEGRVRRALRYGGTAQDTIDHLVGALRRFNEGEFRDDVAIVAVRVRPNTANPPEDPEQ